ncbi:Zinc-regulated transporter [Cladophialophora carrionii]|uniref:Zinc-regulated transporter n=1 Tax=Cladophialophora carrionii TaxID=86049 RepID=A0A1C1D0I8_9EURO|nr:Zinc-regulated transporter [Cladophialophora carrionii]
MTTLEAFAHLVPRQDDSSAPPSCDTGNEYDGRIGLRIAALFIIWVTSSIGAVFPIFANRHRGLKVPEWVFFICKYFGSGVIIATAFIHLLAPAIDALTDPCLTGPITDYDWAEGIVLMTVFVLFFVELMVMRYGTFGGHPHGHEHEHEDGRGHQYELERSTPDTEGTAHAAGTLSPYKDPPATLTLPSNARQHRAASTHVPGEDHMGHVREHSEIEDVANPFNLEDYKAQMTAIFILEFGIIFHSIFIGLTLAVAGEEFNTLFIVIIFHQTFEGLGLGSRLAVTPWPKDRRWTPYLLGLAYGLSTPLSIAIGLGVRNTYPPGSKTTLIVNGVFDSVSAGILIYTGLVELMAHEFMFSNSMRRASIRTVISAFVTMCLGAGLMALLGKWA